MSTRTNNMKKIVLWVLVFATLISAITLSLAIFTDHVNRTASMRIASFDVDGYALERTAPEGYFTAGETIEAVLKETNTQDTDLKSQITMTVIWESPVSGVYPWGNTASENAVITIDGTAVPYTVNENHSISFTLPQVDLSSGDAAERTLAFQIPDNLASTGRLMFEFDNVELVSNGWTGDYDHSKLDDLDYDVGVAWNISKNQTTALGNPNRDVLAVLTETGRAGEYGLHIIKNGDDKNTNQGQMMDWSGTDQTPWADYTIVDLVIDEKVMTIGDYAFAGETGITSVDVPNTITDIGTSAFDGSGLTGELIIPASVEVIESLGFGNLPLVNEITFEHGSDDTLELPDNEAGGKEATGAFYVPTYVTTTINTDNDAIEYEYSWHNDNRRPVPTLAAQDTWYQGTTPKNTISSIAILDYYEPAGTLTEPAWDASAAKDGSVMAYVEPDGSGAHRLIIAGNGYGSIYANQDSTYAFGADDSTSADAFSAATSISGLNLLDTSRTITMAGMFKGCSSVTSLDISLFDTQKVTNMSEMFSDCFTVTSLDVSHFDTKSVTDTNHMFYNCATVSTLDVNGFDTRNVTDMSFMFAGCEALTALDVGAFDTQSVTTTESMFMDCYVLSELDVKKETVTLNGRTFTAWDTDAVTTMASMFANCNELGAMDLSNWDATSVETMYQMFYNCYSVPSINLTNFSTSSKLKNLGSTFYQCQSLPTINLSSFITNGVEDMSATFFSCSDLTDVVFGSNFDGSAVQTIRAMFAYCSSLTDLDLSDFNTSSALTNMYMLFANCTNLVSVDFTNFNTSGVTSMGQMFHKCKNLLELDLSMFNTSKVTGTSGMFNECNVLHTIYVSYAWSNESNTFSDSMFSNCYDLVGGAGTVYSSSYIDAGRALIDGGTTNPGYFTNNIFLSYEDVVVGKTVNPELTIKSTVFDDYVSKKYEVVSGSAYASVNTTTGVVTGKAKGTANVKVTLTATNGDTITATAPVNVMAVSITGATLAYDDVRVGETVNPDLTISPSNAGQYQSIKYEVTAGSTYASVNTSTGVVTGKAKGTATIKVTIVDANGATVTTSAPVNVLAVSITSATLAYDDVTVGQTVDPDLTISPSNAGQYQSIKYEVTAGSTYASVNASTGVVTGKAKGTATVKVTIVDANGATVTTTAPVNVLAIGITGATLAYDDVRVGATVDPDLVISPSNAGQYQSIKYEVTAGSTYASVNASTGVVTGKAKGTATIKVTIVDANGATVTATAPVNVLAVSITSASLTYADVNVGETVNPNLTINPSNAGQYQSIKYEVTAGGTYASVNSSTGVVTGKAKGTATIKVTIVDANSNTITATGTVNVLENTITVVYNANGGSFGSGTTNTVVYRMAPGKVTSTKTSKTANVSTDGSTFDAVGYGDSQSVTDVVQIPGATSLTVTIKYATESTSFDWIAIYDGSVTPTDSNAGSSISGKLGGGKATTSTATFSIPGDTAQFHFVSDSSVSNFYGYYAEVSATIDGYVPTATSGTYADPTGKRYMSFAGWYTNAACTAGNEFNLNKATSNITVYAKWDTVIPVLAAQDTWYTQGNTGIDKTSITSITLKTWYNPSSYVKKWDASAGQVGTVTAYLENGSTSGTYKLTLSGNEYSRIYANVDSSFAFSDYKAATSISGLSVLDTRNVTTMEEMFYDDEKLTSLDVSAFDTGKVESFRNMFSMCENLTSLDVSNFDTRSGTDFGAMFRYCIAMKTLNISTKSVTMNGKTYNSWDTINAEKMSSMFSECDILTTLDVSHFDTRKVSTHSGMFYACEALSNLNIATKSVTMNGRTYDSWDTQSSENMQYMFFKCQSLTSLDVSHFDTADVTTFDSIFSAASKLASLSLRDTSVTQNGRTFTSWVTSSATNMSSMFYACNALPNMTVTYFDTSKVTDFSSMFYGCLKFTSLDVSTFDTRSVTDPECMEHFAHSCPALKTIILGNNFGQASILPDPGGITGMFYYRDTIKTTVKGANSAMKAYGWSTDCRTVTFTS